MSNPTFTLFTFALSPLLFHYKKIKQNHAFIHLNSTTLFVSVLVLASNGGFNTASVAPTKSHETDSIITDFPRLQSLVYQCTLQDMN